MTVKTHEVWFQPLKQLADGADRRIPREELGGHPLYTDDAQQYMLRKEGGRWMIESNPVR